MPRTASARPASSGRPSTARPTTAGAYFDRDTQYTDSLEYSIDEEDEESEAEDVFAFGRPATADQQQTPQFEHGNQDLYHNTIAYDPGLNSPLATPPVSYPSPTFDPNARDRGPTPGPSVYPRHAYPLSPVESPPSTDSQSPDDPYRLRRIAPTPSVPISTPTTGTGRFTGVSSAVSSREVHVSLPATRGSVNEYVGDLKGKGRPPSTPRSTSFPSMMEMDSREGSIKMEFDLDEVDEEDSPFPEVRASVSNIDDPEMPVLTLRMWFIGMLLTLTAGSANMFFNFRQPAPSVVSSVLLLLAHPAGKLMAYLLPIRTWRMPRWLGGYEFSLNPGPWNIKEHALVYMMANVSIGIPYAINAVVVAEINYGVKLGYWFNTMLILATQLTGFALAGLCRRYLVWPASMVWPQNLIVCTMLNTLHADEDDERGGISRFRFFVYMSLAAFFFFFLPGYLFTALSIFSWVCWIVPKNIVVNQLFGVSGGLGMSVLTFDWTQITWIGSPLMVPWWAEVQIFVGFVVIYWILNPILYYTNSWDLAYFPMMANQPYDRFGNAYDVSRVLTPEHTFDAEAFAAYSPLYLPASYAITYLMAFALSSCMIVHALLYHGRMVLHGFLQTRIEKDDIHAKLMRAYPEVPDWWYALSFALFFSLAIVVSEVWHTGIPVWALLLAILLPVTYIIPSGYVYAMTGQTITINLIAQIIPGMILPGKPLPNMIFKSYAVQTLAEGSAFVQDLKLGHYMKVPPRATFIVQLVSTMLVGFLQVGVKEWMFSNIPDICQPNQPDFLTCPHNQVFYTASAIWGLIGPARQFGSQSIYHPQLYALAVGAILPIPFWIWQRRYPNSWNKYVSMPIVLNGIAYIPPATGINYSSWFLLGAIFQFFIRRKNFAWWSKFNYILSAAMDTGTVLSLLFIFFTLQFPKGGSINVNWWGNSVYTNTADYNRLPLRQVPAGGIGQV